MDFRMQDRMELKALVDFYATESDKNNQDCYVEIFRPDIKLNVYFGGKLGMTANDVQDMIRQYKAFGAAKVSFHMNGQQSVDFVDETHATGTCYALATLVTEQDGKDVLPTPYATMTNMRRSTVVGGSVSVSSISSGQLIRLWDNMGKSLKLILASALCMLVSTACGGNSKKEVGVNEQTTTNGKTVMAKDEKALVVFFSHAGDNYAVGNIEVGNTKIVADYITELTGAEQFEIVTHKYDGMAYNPLIKLAKEETKNGELPAYEGDIDLSKYDTVFIGGPVWWGTYPQVMFTFFKKHANDLKGKTVIPFTTHEGSGLANCVEDVKDAFPGANVQKGFSIYGHEVRTEKKKVEKWLNGLGY